MNKFLVVFAAFFFIQTCSSANPGDAEHRLRELRDLTNKRVAEAFLEHSKMSLEVDVVAEKGKAHGLEEMAKKTEKYLAKLKSDKALTHRCRGTRDHIFHHLQKQHSDEMIRCIDETGSQSVNVLRNQRLGLVEYVWSPIYKEEKDVIVCGRQENCLDATVANIQDKVDEVTEVIQAEVDISKHNTEVQVQAIKGCVSRSIANLEHALSKVPTCMY